MVDTPTSQLIKEDLPAAGNKHVRIMIIIDIAVEASQKPTELHGSLTWASLSSPL
jgi:hypothetical protein